MSVPKKARGRPFKPGNPGRPPGSKNRTSQIIEQLAEGQAEQLFQKVLELGRGGDVACLKMLLDRLWPPRKGQPVNIDTPPIKTSHDVLGAIESVWTALGDGRLTPDEATSISLVVERLSQVIQLQDVLTRIEALEQKRRPPK